MKADYSREAFEASGMADRMSYIDWKVRMVTANIGKKEQGHGPLPVSFNNPKKLKWGELR